MSLLLRLLSLMKLGGLALPLAGILSAIMLWQGWSHDRTLESCEARAEALQATVSEQAVVLLKYQAGATAAKHARDMLEYQKSQMQVEVVETAKANQVKTERLMAQEVNEGEAAAIRWLQDNVQSLRFESNR